MNDVYDLVKSASKKLESLSANGGVMMILASARSDLYEALAKMENATVKEGDDGEQGDR